MIRKRFVVTIILLFIVIPLTPMTIADVNAMDITPLIDTSNQQGTWVLGNYGTFPSEPPGTGFSYLYADTLPGEQASYSTPALDLSGLSTATLSFTYSYSGHGIVVVVSYSGEINSSTYEERLLFYHDLTPQSASTETLIMHPSSYAIPSEVYLQFYYFNAGWSGQSPGYAIDDIAINEIGFYEGFEVFNGTLSGYVNNTLNNPIEGARVRVSFHETYEEDYTDATGYYHVTNIPLCYCMKNATASKEGYEPEWILLSITENTTHDFVLTSLDPIPDLDCDGVIDFCDVEPGATVTGSFTVENIGEPNSELNWEIESYPDWGTWTFTPESGTGLKPEDGALTVEVEVITPEDPTVELTGEINLVNSEDPNDFCSIGIFVSIPPPPKTYIGTIQDLEISNESIRFHAKMVLMFYWIMPVGLLINESITITNNYTGFVGERFIFARFRFDE